jgi:hypothetical protein
MLPLARHLAFLFELLAASLFSLFHRRPAFYLFKFSIDSLRPSYLRREILLYSRLWCLLLANVDEWENHTRNGE